MMAGTPPPTRRPSAPPPAPPAPVDTAAIQGLAGTASPGTTSFASEMFYGALSPSDISTTATEATTAANAVKKYEQSTAATQRLMALLEQANIDVRNPLTQDFINSISGGATGEDGARAALALLTGPGGNIALTGFLDRFPEVALTRSTPYSQALAENAFTTSLTPQALGEAQQKAGMSGIPPSQFPTTSQGAYEYSNSTGAIRFANGTIVTEGNGVIFDPTSNAPGSGQYLREAQGWDANKIREWKDKLVSYGYLSKDQAKGDGFTVDMRMALETYWKNYYIAGGKPIAADNSAGAGATKVPLIDYRDFSAQIQNDIRGQLRTVLGVEPTEEQVRAQAQFIMRTATDMQKKFRAKDYGSPGSMALTNATETAIGNIETSPYAQDVRENTQLRDAMQNAAFVSRSLLT